jgi:hypothetical protein
MMGKIPRLLLLGIFLVFTISAAASWWDATWEYRKAVNLTENSGENLEDYQVEISVDTEALISEDKMQNDCSDLRFVQNDVELDYWIESGCNTAGTSVWVEVPSIPAGSTSQINLYYGNSEASSKSNKSKTFTLWDDFGPSWDEKWERTTSDACVDGTTSDAVKYRPCTTNNYGSIQTKEKVLDSSASGYHFEYRWKRPDTSWSAVGIIAYTDGSSDHHSEATDGYRVKAGSDVHCIDCSGGLSAQSGMQLDTWDDASNEWQVLDTNTFSIDDSEYNKMSFSIDGSNLQGSFNNQERVSGSDSSWSGEKVALTAEDEDGPVYADYIEVRRYASPEPTYTVGEELRYGICDRRGPRNECITESSKNFFGTVFDIETVFKSLSSAVLSSEDAQTSVHVSNTSFVSGLWKGSFNISARQMKIRPGAEFQPEGGRIILDER